MSSTVCSSTTSTTSYEYQKTKQNAPTWMDLTVELVAAAEVAAPSKDRRLARVLHEPVQNLFVLISNVHEHPLARVKAAVLEARCEVGTHEGPGIRVAWRLPRRVRRHPSHVVNHSLRAQKRKAALERWAADLLLHYGRNGITRHMPDVEDLLRPVEQSYYANARANDWKTRHHPHIVAPLLHFEEVAADRPELVLPLGHLRIASCGNVFAEQEAIGNVQA